MPKDYSNGKIYQMEPICDHEEGDVYIGSTCQKFISRRLAEHIYDYKKWKNGKCRFVSSFLLFEKYEINNMRIILLESYPCHNNDELRSREAYYQKQNKCVNKCIAFRTKEEHKEKKKQYDEEYIEKHHDERLQYAKQYHEEHKQKISENKKEKITCECGREIRKHQLKRHQRSDIHKELMTKIV